MGSYTYSNFRDYLDLRLGANDAWDSYRGVWVNAAYRQLATRDRIGGKILDIPELETTASATTVDGTAYVAIPTDALVVIGVFDETNDVRLSNMPLSDYRARTDRGVTTSEAKPEKWVRSGSRIYLYPTPDSAYTLTITYRKRPADLSGDSDVTVLGAEWDDVILELSHYIARLWANEPERAEYSRKLAEEMAQNIMGLYAHEEKDRTEKVRPDASWNDKETY